MMGAWDPGAPWRGFDPSTFDVDVPEFELPDPGKRPTSIAACYASLDVEGASTIEAAARLAHNNLHGEAENLRFAAGYAGYGGDRAREQLGNGGT